MLAAMSKAIGQAGINIAGVVLKKLPEGTGLASFEVLVSTREDMDRVISAVKLVKGVLKVKFDEIRNPTRIPLLGHLLIISAPCTRNL